MNHVYHFPRSSTNNEIVFELNQTKDDDDDKLLDDYENELFDARYPGEPQEFPNPCPPRLPYMEFRKQLTRMNDKVYKQIIKAGSGSDVDFERLKVTYDYAMFTEFSAEPFDSSTLNKRQGIIDVKEGVEPLPGSYLALATMKKGEEAVFWISSDVMYGKLGCAPRIKPNADILLHAKITSVEKDVKAVATSGADDTSKAEGDIEENNSFRKFYKKALKNYSLAYDCFTNGKFLEAIRTYRKLIHEVEKARLTNDEDDAKQKKLLIKMYQNVCICYNKISQPQKTCVMMRELEKLTPIRDNPKALFAKGKAHIMLNNFEYARKYLMMAKEIIPDDGQIAGALQELNQREEDTAKYEAEFNERFQLFKDEAFEAAAENSIKAKEKRQADKARQAELDQLSKDFQKLVREFKDDKDIKRRSLDTDDWTHLHVELADQISEQNNVRLKGYQSTKGGVINYYLSK